MDKQKLEYFRNLLLEQLFRQLKTCEPIRPALKGDDTVEDAGEMSELDLNRSTALALARRQSQLLAEIDEALGRIEDGIDGECSRCGRTSFLYDCHKAFSSISSLRMPRKQHKESHPA